MKKNLLTLIVLLSWSLSNSQTPWYLGKNEISGGQTAVIGTVNNHDLQFATNDTVRAVLQTDGRLQLPGLAGDESMTAPLASATTD